MGRLRNRNVLSWILLWCTTMASSTKIDSTSPIKYPLPEFSMKISVLERGLDLVEFQNELEKVTAMHISATLREQLPPTGQLGLDKFNEIELVSQILDQQPDNRTRFDEDDRRTMIDVSFFKGYSVFQYHTNAPPEYAPFVLTAMFKLLTKSFATNEGYAHLVARYQASDTLQAIKGCVISVDNPNYIDPDDDGSNSATGGNSSPAPGTVAALVIMILVVILAVLAFIYIRNKTNSNKRTGPIAGTRSRNKRRGPVDCDVDHFDCDNGYDDNAEDEHSISSTSTTSTARRAHESFLDDWTQKLTSIPLTSTSLSYSKPKQRRPLPRPALQSKRSACLQSIVEESENNSSIADLSTFNDNELITESSALGGGAHRSSDEEAEVDNEEQQEENADVKDYFSSSIPSGSNDEKHHSRIVVL